jgi:Leucine-rich repeat (LRR) protein
MNYVNSIFFKIDYINLLPNETKVIVLSNKGLIELPDLSRFYKLEKLYCDRNYLKNIPLIPTLKVLYCYDNELTSIPEFPNLQILDCSSNKITNIPILNNLEYLICSYNQLTVIPFLPKIRYLCCTNNKITNIEKINSLQVLYCSRNELKNIPNLINLEKLYCSSNHFIILPELPKLKILYCFNNPICDITENDYYINNIEFFHKINKILDNFRKLFYTLKYKKQLKKWLWDKVRRPKIEQIYHPDKILKFIEYNENWEDEIENL